MSIYVNLESKAYRLGRLLRVVVVCVGLLAVGGCGGQSIGSQSSEFIRNNYEFLSKISCYSFAISKEGDIYVSDGCDKIRSYSQEGNLKQVYNGCHEVEAMCISGDELIYYSHDNQLISVSVDDGEKKTILENMLVSEVRNMVSIGNNIYLDALRVQGEQMSAELVQIDGRTGEAVILRTEGEPRAIYAASDGKLYYCAGEYGEQLYSYNLKKNRSELLYNLRELVPGIQTIQAFCFENGYIFLATLEKTIEVLRIDDNYGTSMPLGGIISMGKDFQIVSGNLIVQCYDSGTMKNVLSTIFVDDMFVDGKEEDREYLTIRDSHSGQLDEKRIRDISGIHTKFETGEMYTDEFLASLLAGNENIDIYVLDMSTQVAEAVRNMEMFVPLTESDTIKNYKNDCFSYIADKMVSPTGDIWMLPIAINNSVIWYVPENLEHFGVTTEQLEQMDSFMEVTEKLREEIKDTELKVYVNPVSITTSWMSQYTNTYCDLKNGVVNYQTTEYRELFDKVCTGWNVYGSTGSHPFFVSYFQDKEFLTAGGTEIRFDSKRIIYKYELASDLLQLGEIEGWNVMQEPLISKNAVGSSARLIGLVVNPFSRNKEKAIKYLETVAESPMGIYGGEYMQYTSFLFANKERYSDYYDFSQVAINSLYQIFEKGVVENFGYPNLLNVIDEYQCGKLTLDEAVQKVQKSTEMYLNE